MQEHITKKSPSLDRDAIYTKTVSSAVEYIYYISVLYIKYDFISVSY